MEKCIKCDYITGDCVCLLDGQEKDFLEEKEECSLKEDYLRDMDKVG